MECDQPVTKIQLDKYDKHEEFTYYDLWRC